MNWIGRIVAGMGLQDVAPSAIEPGEDEDLVPRLNSVQGLEQLRLENEPSLRRTLVALLGRFRSVDER